MFKTYILYIETYRQFMYILGQKQLYLKMNPCFPVTFLAYVVAWFAITCVNADLTVKGYSDVWSFMCHVFCTARGYLRCRCDKKRCPPEAKPVFNCNIDMMVQTPDVHPPLLGDVFTNEETDDIDYQLCCLEGGRKHTDRRNHKLKGFRNPYTYLLRLG